jgi:hypothetical protein
MSNSSPNRKSGDRRTIDMDIAKSVLNDLLGFQKTYDLDVETVDGEFYFRCCVNGFNEDIARARSIKRPTEAETIDAFDRAARFLWKEYRLPNHVGFPALLNGRPLRMRTPEVESVTGAQQVGDQLLPITTHVSMRVYSSRVRGEDIAEALLSPDQSRYLGQTDDVSYEGQIQFQWRFVSGVEYLENSEFVQGAHRSPAPYVEIVVKYPLPSKETLAFIYDRECIGVRKLHKELSMGTGQEPDNAIRTWMIALYMASGMDFHEAHESWIEIIDDEERHVSRQNFYDHRHLLLSRVPEAKTCLLGQDYGSD